MGDQTNITKDPKYLPVFTQGICHDGAAILLDGVPITPDQIVAGLNALSGLVGVKQYKDRYGKDQSYKDARDLVWYDAQKALGLFD